MRGLALSRDLPRYELAANLRCAFSGIVSGNVKNHGIRLVEEHGPFELCGELALLEPLTKLLEAFVAQRRMKLPGSEYEPCFRLRAT